MAICVPAFPRACRSPIAIRGIERGDAAGLQRLFDDLSPESRRHRFLSVSATLERAHVRAFCDPDHHERWGAGTAEVTIDLEPATAPLRAA